MPTGSFFRPKSGSASKEDPIYRRVRDGLLPEELAQKAWIEALWQETAPFLDSDLAEIAPEKGLVPVFAEMYFARVLQTNGVRLVPRKGSNKARPDLLSEIPSVWTEVVAPTHGAMDNADALKALQIDEAGFILRLRNALENKREQLDKHIAKAIVKARDAAIIAVSGCWLSVYDNLPDPPYLVQSILGVSGKGMTMDGDALLPFVEARDTITRKNGKAVDTDLFSQPDYSRVSAVLYSRTNWISRPQELGEELVLVHNHNAACPLPKGWLPIGTEYWRQDGNLLCIRYPRTASETMEALLPDNSHARQ